MRAESIVVRSPVPLVDLAAQQSALGDELVATARRMLERTDWILGEEVEAFEREFAAFCDTAHAVGTDSGLSALELILRGYGIGEGDEVITVANTFVATALAIAHAGARPVLVDMDPETYNMDPDAIDAAITHRTRAIVAVHLYGQPADVAAIQDVARRHGLRVIEDAAQAHGARYKRRRAGSLADAAAFSFYPAKNLGGFGDGGAVVTDDAELAEAVRILRNYGQRAKHDHVVKGFNRRLDTLQAAFLRVKLRHLDDWNDRRRAHARRYTEALAHGPVVTPVVAEGVEPAWHLYVIQTEDRGRFRAALSDAGIQTGIHYPVPIHLQEAFADLGCGHGTFPHAEQAAKRILSLPMYPELNARLIDEVVAALPVHAL
jgi:dTDP-4-amino-4,6-dideoxygalactose transaminase